jgi:hypothetical protein
LLNHLGGEVYPDHLSIKSHFVSRQDHVDSPSAAEVHNDFPAPETGEAGGVAATPGEVESDLRHQAKLLLRVEPLIDRIARTGLTLAGSTGLLVATRLRESAVANPDGSLDFIGLHPAPPSPHSSPISSGPESREALA